MRGSGPTVICRSFTPSTPRRVDSVQERAIPVGIAEYLRALEPSLTPHVGWSVGQSLSDVGRGSKGRPKPASKRRACVMYFSGIANDLCLAPLDPEVVVLPEGHEGEARVAQRVEPDGDRARGVAVGHRLVNQFAGGSVPSAFLNPDRARGARRHGVDAIRTWPDRRMALPDRGHDQKASDYRAGGRPSGSAGMNS